MNFSDYFYKPLLYICILSLISCSHIVPKVSYKTNSTDTPTRQIVNYRQESQKRELDTLIYNGKKERSREEFFLKTKDSKKINFWKNYFTTKGKKTLEIFLKNGAKYRALVESIFQKHNLPKELYYVGIIESGYKNHARSHKSAVGPWQFIKDTGRRYGLKITRSIDERKNIYKSTEAAALYFKDLYNIFGSWELALSAYNAGEYGIIRRIRGADTRNFDELSRRKVLPKETRNYVPKVIAAMTLDKKLYFNKIKDTSKLHYLKHNKVNIKKSISLNSLAKQLKISTHIIKKYNHDLKGNYIPYMGRKGINVFLPQKIQIKKITYKRHKKNTRRVIAKNKKVYSTKIKYSYTVKKGDHLTRVSKIFRTPLRKLKKLNKLKRNIIMVGQKLKVPAHKNKYYIVKRGDALIKIAQKYKVSLNQIKSLNQIRRGQIYPGQKIILDLIKI